MGVVLCIVPQIWKTVYIVWISEVRYPGPVSHCTCTCLSHLHTVYWYSTSTVYAAVALFKLFIHQFLDINVSGHDFSIGTLPHHYVQVSTIFKVLRRPFNNKVTEYSLANIFLLSQKYTHSHIALCITCFLKIWPHPETNCVHTLWGQRNCCLHTQVQYMCW